MNYMIDLRKCPDDLRNGVSAVMAARPKRFDTGDASLKISFVKDVEIPELAVKLERIFTSGWDYLPNVDYKFVKTPSVIK